MNRLVTCLLLLLLYSGFTCFAAAEVIDTTVCDVLANPPSFDGKMIRIRNATAFAGFDEFVIESSGCSKAGAIWLAYPKDTGGKAGPAAFLQLQFAKNSSIAAEVLKRKTVKIKKNRDFKRFDSLLATPYESPGVCLGCPRYRVEATLVGRLDGVGVAGIVRDKDGKVTGLDGFGNMDMYRARLILQSVSDVVPHEIDYSAGGSAVRGDSRHAGPPATSDQLKRAIAALGEEGDANGVVVGFGIVNEVSQDEGFKGDTHSPDGILFRVIFDMDRLDGKMISWALAHMGVHIADIRGGVLTGGVEEAETRAWRTTFVE